MSEIKAEDRVRRALEGFRARLYLKFGEKGAKRIMISALIVGIALILLVLALLLLRIDTIVVTGDVTVFNEGEVIKAAEIDIGDGLLWKSTWSIKRNIEKNMPLAQNIKVRKSIFGRVSINIELLSIDYYTKIGDMYYALDEELCVLDSNRSGSKYSIWGAVFIKLPEVREPVLGEALVYYDTVEETNEEKETIYEVKDESFYAYTARFLSALKSSGFHSEANGAILTEKFEVTLIYAEKFSIRFGDASDLEVKFRVLYAMLDEGSTQYSDKVSIDLSDPSRPTSRTDLTLDFSEFIE